MVQDAFKAIENAILDKWKDAPIRDTDGQQTLKLMHKLLADFKGYFEEAVTAGQFSRSALEHERTITQRAKDAARAFRR